MPRWSRLSGLPLWRAATARSLWARAADHPVRRALPLPSTHATSRYFTPLPLAMPQLLHLCFFFPIFLLIFFKAKQLAGTPRKNELV